MSPLKFYSNNLKTDSYKNLLLWSAIRWIYVAPICVSQVYNPDKVCILVWNNHKMMKIWILNSRIAYQLHLFKVQGQKEKGFKTM